MVRLRQIVARLRAPDGCPWDQEQTHVTLRTALVEETYEVLAAIEANDDPNLREELGDLLLHVVMHSQMANERGAFDFDAVASEIGDKMIARHPHVFGDDRVTDSQAVLRRWDEIKRTEKGATAKTGVLAGLPASLPALMRAQKAQEKAGRVGFDWPSIDQVTAKVHEEIAEVREAAESGDAEHVAEEIGDLLFAAVNLARWHKLDAEGTLNRATNKFVRRFELIESALQARGKRWEDASFTELDALWEEASEQSPKPNRSPPPGASAPASEWKAVKTSASEPSAVSPGDRPFWMNKASGRRSNLVTKMPFIRYITPCSSYSLSLRLRFRDWPRCT